MDDTMNIYKEFFKLPGEYKAKFYSNDINKSCRLYSSTLSYDTEEFHYWRDNFTHHCYPLEEYIMNWPNKPTKYREVVSEYSIETRKLLYKILDMICKGLGLEKGYFDGELSKTNVISVNHHIPCPNPSLTLGMPVHSDPNLITLLQQCDVPGLQILKDGKWIGVQPIPHAIVVIPGLQLKDLKEDCSFEECLEYIEDFMLKHGPFDGVLGETDFKRKDGEILLECFVDPWVIHHPEGHTIPTLEDFMSKHGPFDGILGFSMAAILCAAIPGMQREGVALKKVPKIKFVILISGAKFGGPSFGIPKLAINAFSSPINCPSLHFLGEKDYQKKDGEVLLECFVDPQVIHHPKGHVIPELAQGKSPLEGFFDPPYFEWFQSNKDFTEFYNFEECLEYIEEFMLKNGPFDGVLGFSQGAVLGAAIPGMQRDGVTLTKVPKIKFVILISGAKFGGPTYGIPKLATNAFSSPINSPSLHFLGEADFQRKDGEILLECFVDPQVVHHSKGHTIPKLGFIG
ncbi:hypothetical protein KY289_007374 [Solanum tuberosum]|nr:hypothetical protein KY289_007374 [Solanum tuberosum]